jgi:hypothetical protein
MRRIRSVPIAVALLAASVLPVHASSCENGLYIAPAWVQTAKSDAEINGFLKPLVTLGMTQLFVLAKGFVPEQHAALDHFLRVARAIDPRFRLTAMIGRRLCGASKDKCFDASDAQRQAQLESTATGLWRAGFDGVQLDFEPVPDGDETLVAILGRLRRTRPPGKTLSLAGYFLQPDAAQFHFRPNAKGPLLQWTPGYYRRLLAQVDQVMVMVYDTALADPDEYRAFASWQTTQFLELARPQRAAVQIGLPSDVPGRTGLYDRRAENLRTGLEGVAAARKSIGGTCPAGFGITVFTDAGFTSALREYFERTWVR